MVASHLEKQLTRSLVRIPNSGWDRSAGTILHDLSRVSSAAALAPIANYLPLGMLPSGMSPQPPSSLPPLDDSLKKLTSGVIPAAAPRAAAGNGSVQAGTAVNGVVYRPTTEAAGSSGAGVVSRVGCPRTTLAPPRHVLGNVTSSTSVKVTPRSGRKRLIPALQDASLATSDDSRSPKVARITTRRPAQSRSRSGSALSMETLLREREELRAENLALKQQLMRRFQLAGRSSGAGPVMI